MYVLLPSHVVIFYLSSYSQIPKTTPTSYFGLQSQELSQHVRGTLRYEVMVGDIKTFNKEKRKRKKVCQSEFCLACHVVHRMQISQQAHTDQILG